MQQEQQEIFDLLPLLWWQRPSLWLGLVIIAIVVIGGLALVSWWVRRSRTLSPVQELEQLFEAFVANNLPLEKQQAEAFVRLLKAYVHDRQNCACARQCTPLTDRECFALLGRFLQEEAAESLVHLEAVLEQARFSGGVGERDGFMQPMKQLLGILRLHAVQKK